MPPPLSIGTPACSSLRDEFHKFYSERDKDKHLLYESVFKFGALLLLPSAMGALIVLLALVPTWQWTYAFVPVCLIPACLGFVILTSVPHKELDLDEWLNRDANIRTHKCARFTMGVPFAIGGVVFFILVFPYFPGAVLIAAGLWTTLSKPPAGDVSHPPPPSTMAGLFVLAFHPRNLTSAFYLLMIAIGVAGVTTGFNEAFTGAVFSYAPMYLFDLSEVPDYHENATFYLVRYLVPAILGSMFIAWMVVHSLRSAARVAAGISTSLSMRGLPAASIELKAHRGWRTALLYQILQGFGFTYAFVNAYMGIINFLFGRETIGVLVAQLISGVTLLFGALWVPLGGSKLSMLFVLRYFEFKPEQLRKDGAQLASLVSRSTALDTISGSHWLKRGTPPPVSYPTQPGTVDRNEWVLGEFIEDDVTVVRVSFPCDTSPDWSARYVGDKLVLRMDQRAQTSVSDFFREQYGDAAAQRLTLSRDPNPSLFDAWRDGTFDKALIVDPNVGKRYECVLVRLEHKAGSTMDVQHMEEWAKTNLREFPWPGPSFEDDLLRKSPRDEGGCKCEGGVSGSQCPQKRCYEFSRPVTSADARIDYFLSHAWPDSSEAKVVALRDFFAGKSSSTLWFDKVCIIQCADEKSKKMRENAIAALPVNVGACKKMLVLLGPKYLERLWCVWELQSVFTFCVKELALERIEVVAVGGDNGTFDVRKALSKWSLDEAHCFDPNEEYRLRRLVFDIGEERFYDSVRNLAICIRD